jgi:hypothetical protein
LLVEASSPKCHGLICRGTWLPGGVTSWNGAIDDVASGESLSRLYRAQPAAAARPVAEESRALCKVPGQTALLTARSVTNSLLNRIDYNLDLSSLPAPSAGFEPAHTAPETMRCNATAPVVTCEKCRWRSVQLGCLSRISRDLES